MLLPAVTLALFYMAIYTRLMRASMLEVYGLDYVRTAQAKGLAGGKIAFKHVLRNALLPVVTVAGLQVGSLLGGSVRGRDGVRLARPRPPRLRRGVPARLQPLLGILLLCSVVVVLANLVVDMLYAVLDPRIEYQ